MVAEIKIIVACGTAIATATAVAVKLRSLAEESRIKANIICCKVAEVDPYLSVQQPDVVVGLTMVPGETRQGNQRFIKNVPVFSGVPFLTGIGMKEEWQKILKHGRER